MAAIIEQMAGPPFDALRWIDSFEGANLFQRRHGADQCQRKSAGEHEIVGPRSDLQLPCLPVLAELGIQRFERDVPVASRGFAGRTRRQDGRSDEAARLERLGLFDAVTAQQIEIIGDTGGSYQAKDDKQGIPGPQRLGKIESGGIEFH
jgi:hypothetical protein